MRPEHQFQTLINFHRTLGNKDSEEVNIPIWTNFDGAAITYLSNTNCALFFANTNGPGTSFQAAVFVEFFDQIFSFII